MSFQRLFSKSVAFFLRRKPVDDLNAEIQSHLEMEEREQQEAGMAPDEAHYAALRRFGNVALIEERSREMWRWNLIENLGQDVRYGMRQLLRNRGFTLVAVLTLALGIGANTALFSVLDAVLLRPLPYPEPQRLVKLWTRFTGIGLPNDQNWVSAPEFQDFQQYSQCFSDLAAISTDAFNIGLMGIPQRVVGATVSPSLFTMLGVQPRLGRAFLPEEAQPGNDHEVILSSGLWERAFGSNPAVIGSTIRVDAVPMTVVGVMPPGFNYPDESEIWSPLAFKPDDLNPDNRGNHEYEVLARIRPGLTTAQVHTDLARVSKAMIEQNRSYPYESYGFRVLMNPLLDETVGEVKASLWVLMGAVAMVLLIACANVANLLLARASGRQKDMAVRVALGAGRSRLVGQLLTESVLLGLTGGITGLAVAPLALHGLLTLGASVLPRIAQIRIDVWALAFTLAVSLATGMLFGLAPALQAGRDRNHDLLKSARGSAAKPTYRLRRALVMGEAAISLVLLAGAGLLLRSFVQVLRVNPGFRPEGVLTMRVSLPPAKYSKPDQIRNFYRELVDRVQNLPGVKSAGAVSLLPLGGQGNSGTTTIDTQEVPPENATPESDWRAATPGYFQAMGISLIRGRYFDERDTESSQPVTIIDETLAQTFWPHGDPLGKRLHRGGRGSTAPWTTVVGVVSHVHNRTLEARSRTEVYWPESQNPYSAMALAIRVSGNPLALAPTIQSVVFGLDHDLPVYKVRAMSDVMGESLARRRLALLMLGVFAGLAMLLASVGIYGVTSYTVSQRLPEIGLRMALGAPPAEVLGMVMAQGMSMTLYGLGLGLVMALGLTRLMGSLLFSVRASDPLALGGAALILVIVALLATLIPARRATKVDPMVALRYE